MANFAKTRAARESMEAADEVIDGISNVEPAEENLDVQLADVASIDGQLEQLETDGETLAADTERTEDAIEQAEEAVANGEEMPEEAVALHEVAQESIARRWNLERTKLARESYRRGRGMTAAAQEGWKETLKGLYERFIQFCKEVIAKIKDLKLKYFNVGKTAQKRAKKYQEMIRKLGKQDKDNISGGFITKLSIEGKFDAAGSIAIAKEVTAGKAKGAISALEKQAGEAVTAVTKGDDDAFKAMRGDQPVELFGKAASKLHSLPNFENGDASKLLALPGNAYVQAGTKELAGGHKFTAIAFMSTGDASDDKEVATPSVSEMAGAAS
ncbi:preprotein translocase subunit YajC, partial [Escherichia coli]